MRAELQNSERVLFSSASGLRIGAFRRYPWNAGFEDSGPIQGWLLVFPRTSVVIQHAGGEPIVADPTRAMLYNRGQEYRRRAVGESGDECEWFSFPPALLDEPFQEVCASVDARTYLLQRRLTESDDPLFVEEGMLVLLERCTGKVCRCRVKRSVSERSVSERSVSERSPLERSADVSGTCRCGLPRRANRAAFLRRRELAEACRDTLSSRMTERLSLVSLARSLRVSPFHLSRAFRAETGLTLYRYLHELRLRTALARVRDGEDLSAVAHDFGYASHSHFTARFRRVFGETPSHAKS